jgi:Zn-dependent peptidase ImmA (M78 family)/transcriptional regulator with XRE-family HTH domain
MIYGERIRQAREFKGLTQTYLADLVGVKQAAISEMERGEFAPSQAVLQAIAKETGFLPTFFELVPHNLPLGTLNYRAKKSVSARQEAQAYQYANLLYEQVSRVAPDVAVPPNRLPQLTDVSPSRAAQLTRDIFGLTQDEPIKRLLRTIEKNGVFILTLPRMISGVDAFSTWAEIDEVRPIVVMLPGKPMDRQRYNVAHELGHLVLHRTIRTTLKLVENEANMFSSEFLMPERAMRDEMRLPITLTGLAKLKLRWGVSIQALIMRARSLKIVTDRQTKYLFTQLSAQGWRTREPSNLDVKTELPKLVRSMIETRYGTREDYATESGMALDTATEFYAYI